VSHDLTHSGHVQYFQEARIRAEEAQNKARLDQLQAGSKECSILRPTVAPKRFRVVFSGTASSRVGALLEKRPLCGTWQGRDLLGTVFQLEDRSTAAVPEGALHTTSDIVPCSSLNRKALPR